MHLWYKYPYDRIGQDRWNAMQEVFEREATVDRNHEMGSVRRT
jgi:hypothetical protein